MNKAFEVHILNERGRRAAKEIALKFDGLMTFLSMNLPEGREMSIVATKLEEACFFAKKAMASQIENCTPDREFKA